MPTSTPDVDLDTGTDVAETEPWTVLVWNDDVNLMAMVTRAFQTIFGYSKEKAATLMIEVHQTGKSAVWTGERDRAEAYVAELGGWQISATLKKG